MKFADAYSSASSSASKPAASLPATVAEIGKIHFEGNIIPHLWYQRITLQSGKPDLPAIIILAEVVYWYRPYQTLDERGQPLRRKHFDGDMFQGSAAYFCAKFGLTKDQTRKALKRLEDAGYIRREYRDIVHQGILRNNVMFIEPVPSAILAITHPAGAIEAAAQPVIPPSPPGETPSPPGETPSPGGDMIKGIKITTEISTKNTTTTPNPSFTDERTEEPSNERGSSNQDKNPQGSAIDQEPTTLGTTKGEEEEAQTARAKKEIGNPSPETQKTVTSEQVIKEQRPELVYPEKLSAAEHEDIARQIHTLPWEVAQQVLDVLQSQIQSNQIRTNPAAVLRGIVRKYHADPESFDPSPGFHVAQARHSRQVAHARLQEALQAHPGRSPTLPPPNRQNGPRERPAGLEEMLRVAREELRLRV